MEVESQSKLVLLQLVPGGLHNWRIFGLQWLILKGCSTINNNCSLLSRVIEGGFFKLSSLFLRGFPP
jgi:hypothetical protein